MRADCTKFVGKATLAAAMLTLAGCADTVARRDLVAEITGDSVAANKAIHIIDPWPRPSFNTRLSTNGSRAAASMGGAGAGPKPVAFGPVISTGGQGPAQ